ncbi:MAG: chemotaxis protein CheW [Rubrivivax sp.]|nr:MAG: chemotaxis protein CheW [Rubrivivax sp.]
MNFADLARGVAPPAGELRYGFKVAGLQLVPAARVLTEMMAEARVFPVPKSASALAGVTNLRGTIVPLLDRREVRRGSPNIRPFQHRVLVFDREEQRVGLLLDAQPELLTLVPAPADTPRPATKLSDYLVKPWAQADRPDQIWWEFNHRAAFESLARGAHPASVKEVTA